MAPDPLPSNVRTRQVDDPMALRALAHPVRLKLHGLVAREGTLTAADAARQLGISHALASHHLRQLAKYGFVEPADAADDRARPWRVTATSMSLNRADPDTWAANDVIVHQRLEEVSRQLTDWQRRREEVDARWLEITGVFDSLLYLDADELEELVGAWHELVMARALDRPIGHADRRPAGARPIGLTMIAVPLEPTESGG